MAGRSDWQSPLYSAPGAAGPATAGVTPAALALWMLCSLSVPDLVAAHPPARSVLAAATPGMAVLAGLGADWIRCRGWSIVLGFILAVTLLTNFTYISTDLAGLSDWTGDLVHLRRHIPKRLNAPLAAIDAELPDDAKVLLVGQAAVFHFDHRILYNTVFNKEIIETLATGKDPEEIRRTLRGLGLTHVYVDWFRNPEASQARRIRFHRLRHAQTLHGVGANGRPGTTEADRSRPGALHDTVVLGRDRETGAHLDGSCRASLRQAWMT